MLLCLCAVVLGETVQSAEKELDVYDTVIRGEESDPFGIKVLERILLFDLLSSDCLGQNIKREWE